MTQHLPEWIMQRYAILWEKFGEREFNREEAEKLMNKDKSMPVFLSDLKKAGWVEMKMNPKDARKTIYKLKNPAEAILEEIKELSKR